jgi:hypothetical protein
LQNKKTNQFLIDNLYKQIEQLKSVVVPKD